ncbi:MAG TPA: DUF4158 domain-containing protein, partial [bacterium]|nr:DUF4158 domain-containing protein [bacterium]
MKRNWSTDELIEFFTLTPKDLELIGNKTGATRLGFSVLLKFFQVEARFPSSKGEVPEDITIFIAKQLKLSSRLFQEYKWQDRSFVYHKVQVREYFGFKETTNEDNDMITEWLYTSMDCYDKDKVKIATYAKYRNLKIEPPTPERIERLAISVIFNYERRLFEGIHRRVPSESILMIDALIKELSLYEDKEELKDTVTFNMLRSDPGRICLESVFNEIHKLQTIRKLKLPNDLFDNIPHKVLKEYKQRVSSELLGEIRRHPDEIKYSLLAIFFWLRSREITDNLVELLIAIIHKIDVRAARKVERDIVR